MSLPATFGDAQAAPALVADMPAGTEVLGDSAYGSGEFRALLPRKKLRAVIKPGPLVPAVPGGFTIDDFHQVGRQLTCPAGTTARRATPATGRASGVARCGRVARPANGVG